MEGKSPKESRGKVINKNKRFTNTDYNIKKRAPHKYERNDSVIYVSSKSNIKALLAKCDKLIKNDEKELTIHCMGAAIQQGILLALQVCEAHVGYESSVNTSTVELVDDLEPATDDVDYDILRRNNSALRIKIFRPNNLEPST